MKKFAYVSAMCAMLVLAAGAQATSTFWITDNATGTAVENQELKVNVGEAVTVYAFFNTDMVGNTLEMFFGYDQSNATTFGIGKDTNNGANKDLVLASTSAEIIASMDPIFTTLKTANLDASARQASNTFLGGRPYGVQLKCAMPTSAALETTKIATLTFTNNLQLGESAYLVLADNGSGSSYTNYWAQGTTVQRGGYALKVTAVPEPISILMLALGGLGLLRRKSC